MHGSGSAPPFFFTEGAAAKQIPFGHTPATLRKYFLIFSGLL
jgi:hypothetical protein